MGFVNEVVPDEELDAAVDRLVDTLRSRSALVLAMTSAAVADAAEAMAPTAGA